MYEFIYIFIDLPIYLIISLVLQELINIISY